MTYLSIASFRSRSSFSVLARMSLVALIAGAGCVDNEQFGHGAAACARVVKIFHGLPNPVEVTRATEESAEVRIEYEGVSDLNIPVKGTATCSFAGTGDALSLESGRVDAVALAPEEIASLNRALSSE